MLALADSGEQESNRNGTVTGHFRREPTAAGLNGIATVTSAVLSRSCDILNPAGVWMRSEGFHE
jgi:hypothetical protein